jgi:hypothetical protein
MPSIGAYGELRRELVETTRIAVLHTTHAPIHLDQRFHACTHRQVQ